MKVSRDTMMVICSYLTTKELIKLIDPLCFKLRHDINDSVLTREGRKCELSWHNLRSRARTATNALARGSFISKIIKSAFNLHQEVTFVIDTAFSDFKNDNKLLV